MRGFTLIELIVVIVVLGILSVVAAPKFIDLSSDAEKAMAKSVASALQSGIKMTQYYWLIQGQGSRLDSVPGLSTSDAVFNSEGYLLDIADKRRGAESGTVTTLTTGACGRIWNAILDHSPSLSSLRGRGSSPEYYRDEEGVFYFARNASDTTCYYALMSDNSIVIEYNAVNGTVTYTD